MNIGPKKIRGRRESRVPGGTRSPCAKGSKHTVVTTGSPGPRPSLRDGFNGFLRALPGDRALLPPSPAGLLPASLTPASGRQNHTTSPSAATSLVHTSLTCDDAAASTASHPDVRDDRDTPLVGNEMTGDMWVICLKREEDYFLRQGWTVNSRADPSGKSV